MLLLIVGRELCIMDYYCWVWETALNVNVREYK